MFIHTSQTHKARALLLVIQSVMKVLKRGLSGTIDGLKVSALADTGAAQNVVSRNFARARKLDVAGSPSSFMQGNSKLAHSLGTSKNPLDNLTK